MRSYTVVVLDGTGKTHSITVMGDITPKTSRGTIAELFPQPAVILTVI